MLPIFRQLLLNRRSVPWLHNGTWSIGGAALINSPTLGSELLTNTEFTSNTTGWTALSGATLTQRDFTTSPDIDPTGGSDNFGLEISNGGTANATARQQPTIVIDTWYQLSVMAHSPSTATTVNTAQLNGVSPVVAFRQTNTEDVWEQLAGTGKASSTTGDIRLRCTAAVSGDKAYFDAPSFKALTLNQLFAVRTGSSLPASVSATGTITTRAFAGVVYGLNSISTPTNGIVAVHDGGSSLIMYKIVAGVWTTLISTTASYVAGILPEIRWVSANTFALYYDSVQRGTNQSVSDAGTGLLHGIFSTSGGNTITSFTVT